MKHLIILALVWSMAACTSIEVRPVSAGLKITDVCIEQNPKVIVADFLPVVRDGFDRHGIATRLVNKPAPQECEYVLTYTAFKTWDLATYLHHAELRLYQRLNKSEKLVGSANYHLIGGGGFSLLKWQSTKTKMEPVIDKLLANVNQ